MLCRSSLVIAAALAALGWGTVLNAANARDYKIGCAHGDCVLVDDTGRISFFTIGDRKLSDSNDQLKAPALGRIRPPLNIACGAGSSGAPASSRTPTATSGWGSRAPARFRRAGGENSDAGPALRGRACLAARTSCSLGLGARAEERVAAPGRSLGFGDRRAFAPRQAAKAIENVVCLPDGGGDLALEAIAIGGRRDRVSVEIALASRDVLGLLVGGRSVGAGRDKWARANEPA